MAEFCDGNNPSLSWNMSITAWRPNVMPYIKSDREKAKMSPVPQVLTLDVKLRVPYIKLIIVKQYLKDL